MVQLNLEKKALLVPSPYVNNFHDEISHLNSKCDSPFFYRGCLGFSPLGLGHFGDAVSATGRFGDHQFGERRFGDQSSTVIRWQGGELLVKIDLMSITTNCAKRWIMNRIQSKIHGILSLGNTFFVEFSFMKEQKPKY